MTAEIILFYQSPESVKTWQIKQWDNLVQYGYANKMMASIAAQIELHNLFQYIPLPAQWHFQSALKSFLSHQSAVKNEIEHIVNSLKISNITPLFLKGAAYITDDNLCGRGRIFSDIDVCVHKDYLQAAEQILGWHGWTPADKDDYDQFYYRQWMHEIPPLIHEKRGTVLDLHHNILPPISGRAPEIDLFITTQKQSPSGAMVFSTAAQTLHSLVHLFFEEDFSKGFRDICDLHLFFIEHQQDKEYWSELLKLATETGFCRELFFACRYCEKLFNSPVPATFTMALVNYSPTPLRLKFNDWLFLRVLQPAHPLCHTRGTGTARFIAMLRGHLLKMPTHILLYHLSHKLYKSVVEGLLGKQKSKWQTEQQKTDQA